MYKEKLSGSFDKVISFKPLSKDLTLEIRR
jgi:hypothetical protein